MTKTLDPLNVENGWHSFLYRSVLLEWETSVHSSKKFPRFNAQKPLSEIVLVRVAALKDMEAIILRQAESTIPMQRLVFHSSGTVLKDLFGLLRNCVAHGHYSCPRRGWIEFHHEYKGKIKLSGQVKFKNLKQLISEITASISANKNVT